MAKVGYIGQVKEIGLGAGVVHGGLGGITCGLLGGFLGPLIGGTIGGVLAGAAIGGQDGRIVAINGVQDAITATIVGAIRGGG